nr:hypothetical protein [Kibdelosporangium sp. MJ126-NF4]CEL20790.1 hypothetical protein [Kibdelosporangium sp. MJ126-NF4]CTQ98405.1 hypothetical protein [Kibdelosporangium sp. MJ126-NF4]
MRKFLAAGVLAAATTMSLLPVSTAQATPVDNGHGPDAMWTYVEGFDDVTDCMETGMAGQWYEDWDHFTCDFDIHSGEWQLLVGDHDDGDNNG